MTSDKPPYLQLNRLTAVVSDGSIAYDQSFHSGVNIIRGANGSGKSTIADFIFFLLGGDVAEWKDEAGLCDFVIGEVEINGEPVTLRRHITKTHRQPMQVYFGNYESARKAPFDKWLAYPFQRSAGKESFSQLLFRALRFPEVRSDGDSNITMHQILRLIYVDQLSPAQSLMRAEGFDSPLIREAAGNLLLGVYDDSLLKDELELRQRQKEREALDEQVENISSLLRDSGLQVEGIKLQQEIADARAAQSDLEERLKAARRRESKSLDKATSKHIEKLGNQLIAAQSRYAETINNLQLLTVNIEDSSQFLNSLNNRLQALEDSTSTRKLIGVLSLNHCPECLSRLDTKSGEEICALCKSPRKNDSDGRIARMRQELALQIKESERLLKDKTQQAISQRVEIPVIRRAVENAQRDYDLHISQARSQRDQEIDDLLIRTGSIQSHIDALLRQSKTLAALEALKNQLQAVVARVATLQHSIKTKRREQERRLKDVRGAVERYSIKLLHADLNREEVFRVAESVAFDFAHDTFSVNKKNQFSASSIIYLKNTVHFSILFASIELGFMRYPRFILCDNVEDKGMEELRSQNFQERIVEIASTLKGQFQIIFTTSMISPQLNTTQYCIGPQYDENNKSLRVKKPRR